MKYFPFIDFLDYFKKEKLSRTSQLFLISLIAHYHEKERIRGDPVGINIIAEGAVYKLILSDKEIHKKFNFSIDTIIKIKRELDARYFIINTLEISSGDTSFNPAYHPLWRLKYYNFTKKYLFAVKREGRKIVDIPTKIIYDKDLTYSEKLAIVWNLCLKERFGRKPKLREIERESSISERTIRKAKKKYPKFFMN